MLSVAGREGQKVAALDAGADDYVTKPFGMDELLARLRAARPPRLARAGRAGRDDGRLHRRPGGQTRHPRDGGDVRLTPTEWQLLEVLVRNPGRLVTQRQLLQEVWGRRTDRDANYLRVYVAQLRRKLEPIPRAPLPAHRARDGLPVQQRQLTALRTPARPARDRLHRPLTRRVARGNLTPGLPQNGA